MMERTLATPAATAGAGAAQYLDTREAAALARCSPRTLERLRLTGDGPRYRKPGRGLRSRVLYRRGDVEAWIEAASFGSTTEYGTGEM